MPAVHVAIAGRHSRADGDDAHLNPSALRREHFFVRACVSSEAVRPGRRRRRRRRCVRVRLCFVWWSTNACVSSLKTPKRNDYNIYIGLRLGSERTSERMHDMLHETEYALRVCIYVCSIFNMLQHRFWDWHRTHADAHAETRTRHDTPATNLNSNISMRVHLCDSRKSCACMRACVFVRVVVHCRARARARMRAYVCVCVCDVFLEYRRRGLVGPRDMMRDVVPGRTDGRTDDTTSYACNPISAILIGTLNGKVTCTQDELDTTTRHFSRMHCTHPPLDKQTNYAPGGRPCVRTFDSGTFDHCNQIGCGACADLNRAAAPEKGRAGNTGPTFDHVSCWRGVLHTCARTHARTLAI